MTFVLLGRGQQGAAPTAAQIGAPAPAFDERDVISGQAISSAALQGKNILLYFSEGAACAPCLQQIQALEQRSADLKQRGLVLVNVTNDEAGIALQAAQQYRITTPLIADDDRNMSGAYDVLDQGMHADTLGHTFILVDSKGVIRWRRDYWLRTMYVPPDKLLRRAAGGRARGLTAASYVLHDASPTVPLVPDPTEGRRGEQAR